MVPIYDCIGVAAQQQRQQQRRKTLLVIELLSLAMTEEFYAEFFSFHAKLGLLQHRPQMLNGVLESLSLQLHGFLGICTVKVTEMDCLILRSC